MVLKTVVSVIGLAVLSLTVSAPCQQDSSSSNSQNAATSQPPSQPASQSSPSPLSTPSITGPLQAGLPITFDAGPLGKLSLDGVLSGIGLVQANHASGDSTGDG
jgi:hypothetical protein